MPRRTPEEWIEQFWSFEKQASIGKIDRIIPRFSEAVRQEAFDEGYNQALREHCIVARSADGTIRGTAVTTTTILSDRAERDTTNEQRDQ